MADAPKRSHDPPAIGLTPGKKQPKRRSTSGKFSKRSLFSSEEKDVRMEKDQKVSCAIVLCQILKCITCIILDF